MNTWLSFLFRPLARLCIAQGLRYADVAEHLRRAYFCMGQEALGPAVNDSRLSVMTGLQRRDIARLKSLPSDPQPAPDPLSRLVALWLAQHDGAPLPLHGEGSFDALARDVRRDVHPKALRDALEAAGTLHVEGAKVLLLHRAHVPRAGSAAQLEYLARNVGDHLEVAVGNVMGEAEGFELAVHYNGLSRAAAHELESLWRARLRPVLEEVNAQAATLQNTSPGPHRIRGGGFFKIGEDG